MNLKKLFLYGSLLSIAGSQIIKADPMIFDADRGACQNAVYGATSYPEQMKAFGSYSAQAVKDTFQQFNSFTPPVAGESQSVMQTEFSEVSQETAISMGKEVASFGALTKDACQTIQERVREQGGYFVQTVRDHKFALSGVVAVITLSGLTYYLYQNGQLHLIGQKAQSYFQKAFSYKKTLIAAGLLAASGIALYAAYQTGYVKIQAVDRAKDTITGTITILSFFSKIAAGAARFNASLGDAKVSMVNSFNAMTYFMQTSAAPTFASKVKTAAIMLRPYAQPLPILACTGIAAATGYMAKNFYKENKTK